MKSKYQILSEKIDELQEEVVDGHDAAYVYGWQIIAQEFKPGDGNGDGGLTDVYLKGLKDAINFLDNS